MECGANYLLWIDADHWFPEHSLLRLLSLNRPVVGANYPTRFEPIRPTAASLAGEPGWTTQEMAARGEVEQVSHIGLGFWLIDMNVIHAIRGRQPEGRRDPLFAPTFSANTSTSSGASPRPALASISTVAYHGRFATWPSGSSPAPMR